MKIDSKYYIESQILPPLERVFEAIGMSKSELVGMGRQILLTDAIKKSPETTALKSIDGFICNKCNKTFRRTPLIGKCFACGGEIVFYSGEINFEVKDKIKIIKNLEKKFKSGKLLKLDGLRVDFPDWWFLIRPSNTEPLLRLVVEAKTEKLMRQKVKELELVIKNS